jgi:hypothetical protein
MRGLLAVVLAFAAAVAAGGIVLFVLADGPQAAPGECAVFLEADASSTRLDEVEALVRDDPAVFSVSVVTQEEALVEFGQMFADRPELVASMTAEVLPPSVRATLRQDDSGAQYAFTRRYAEVSSVRDAGCRSTEYSVRDFAEERVGCMVNALPGEGVARASRIGAAIRADDSASIYTVGVRGDGSTADEPAPQFFVGFDDETPGLRDEFAARFRSNGDVAEVFCEVRYTS